MTNVDCCIAYFYNPISSPHFKPLTHKDATLGIGRKFTEAELTQYLSHSKNQKPKSLNQIYNLSTAITNKINITFYPQPQAALFEMALNAQHTNNYLHRLSQFPIPGFNYMICSYLPIAALKLRCIAIDDWVIAFKQTTTDFTVHYILYQAGLR